MLLPATIEDTRDRLLPKQLANAVPSGMDAIVHDCRMLMKHYGRHATYIMVSVDARNAFNTFSRQEMLAGLPTQTRSLARFLNLIYGLTKPDLVLFSAARFLLSSQEGTQ